MSEAKPSATMTIPTVAYQMQQNLVKKLEAENLALKKGQPGVNTAQQEENMELKARNAALERELAALKAARQAAPEKKSKVSMKVTDKGMICVSGLTSGWPITLGRRQFLTIFDLAPDLRQFITANADRLKSEE